MIAFLSAIGSERLINEPIRYTRICSQLAAKSAVTLDQLIVMPA
jgi:hypothetical protein